MKTERTSTLSFITKVLVLSFIGRIEYVNGANIAPISDPGCKAYNQQSPHAQCHFRPTHPGTPWNHRGKKHKDRFFEGWYYRITLPKEITKGELISFAFIFSIEDPFKNRDSDLSLACHQIMGPKDEYLIQCDKQHKKFWAWGSQQALGCNFEYDDSSIDDEETKYSTALDPEEWNKKVKSGFQMLPRRLQGKLIGHDGCNRIIGKGAPGECSYDMTIDPITGYGDEEVGQKATAGWLAGYAVFEPHWQVTMSDARASGTVTWKGKTYNFQNVPFYAEKNWGGMFPLKWYWVQCNSFEGYTGDKDNHLSVTAGGGSRKIPFGQVEDVGMVAVHFKGTFYEAVPWTGSMEWDVQPWGSWKLKGRCTSGNKLFETELEAVCDDQVGVKLRAPTKSDGMVYFCKDSFFAHTTLSMWELEYDKEKKEYVRGKVIIDGAKSSQGAVEVGGGLWWDDWKGKSKMKQPLKFLVTIPYSLANFKKRLFSHGKKSKQ